jgi:lysophospholipase L1-like esterase
MKKQTFTFILFVVISCLPWMASGQTNNKSVRYPDPTHFENEIRAFEQQDSLQMPPTDAIVCTGSSSMRFWHDSIREDLAPLTVIPRGFGGSNMNDLLYYTDRIVLKYNPRAVLVYEGDNDIAQGISPEKIKDTFIAFVNKVQHTCPDCRIYFISIKPSLARWSLWPEMEKANRMIEGVCNTDKRLNYIDVSSGMLGKDGKPLPGIFIEDGLHMNREGYLIWKQIIRPVLIKEEGRYEKTALLPFVGAATKSSPSGLEMSKCGYGVQGKVGEMSHL